MTHYRKGQPRYAVPQFAGQENIPNYAKRVYIVLTNAGATTILDNQKKGCFTFRLTPHMEDPEHALMIIEDGLQRIHPNCALTSYRTGEEGLKDDPEFTRTVLQIRGGLLK